VYFKESVHGPISGTVKVGGKLYAVATDRADRGREPQGEVAFSELDSNEVHNPQEFFNAANNLETTFNMAYVDSKHIAFFSTGLLPKTAAGTNPSLPTFGTGAYDWKGWLSENEHPHEVDPASGLLLEQQAGSRLGSGIDRMGLRAAAAREDVHGLPKQRREALQRRVGDEQGRDGRLPRAVRLAGDHESARNRSGAAQTR
jgi:acyl-homoserine lactone acylase PvdQ